MTYGKIIAFEGTDKAGKHTQVTKTTEYLRARGIATETLDFPQYNSFFGQIIKNYLNGNLGGVYDLPMEYSMLPYALDWQQAQPQIAQWLRDGKWVILDRYTYSNVFSVAKCPRPQWNEKIKFMEELEFNQMGIRRPDYNIYLYLDPVVSYNMRNTGLKPYQNGRPDIHESNLKLLQTVADVYKHIAANAPTQWTIIDEMRPDGSRMGINSVFNRVRMIIDRIIDQTRARK